MAKKNDSVNKNYFIGFDPEETLNQCFDIQRVADIVNSTKPSKKASEAFLPVEYAIDDGYILDDCGANLR